MSAQLNEAATSTTPLALHLSGNVLDELMAYLTAKSVSGDEAAKELVEELNNRAAEPMRVIIERDGGAIRAVKANHPCQVITLDEDLEGADEDEIGEISGQEWVIGFWGVTLDAEDGYLPEEINQIGREIDEFYEEDAEDATA